MIRRLVVVTLSLFACHVQAPFLHADPDSAGLIPLSVVEQYNLQRAWFTQARVLPMRGESAYLRLHVSLAHSQTVCRVTDQHGQTYEFSERHLDVFGKPLGVEGAEKAAAEKIRLLKQLNGIDATVDKRVVPDITLYMSSSVGVVQSVDAETGRIRWSTSVGRPDYATTTLAANDELVALVNGQHLYILRAEDGTLLDQRRVVGGAPAAGPAIMGSTIFVPTLSGQLHAYQFGPKAQSWPTIYYAKGVVRFPPTAIGGSVVWPTDAGNITAIDPSRPGAKYRLQLEDPIAGPVVYSPPQQMLTVTRSGYLYSFDVKTGGIAWRFSTGDATAEPASVVGDTVYVISKHAGMRAVATTTGQEKWWTRGVNHFIAASEDRVYTTAGDNVLTVIDAQSGKILSEFPLKTTDRAFVNNQTDRIYIGTDTGLVQCLHERGAHWPTVHVTGTELAAADAAQAEASKTGRKEPGDATDKPADPFATEPAEGGDPFGGPAAKKEPPAPKEPAAKKPAAGGAPTNPFEDDAGGGDAKAEDDADAKVEAEDDSADK